MKGLLWQCSLGLFRVSTLFRDWRFCGFGGGVSAPQIKTSTCFPRTNINLEDDLRPLGHVNRAISREFTTPPPYSTSIITSGNNVSPIRFFFSIVHVDNEISCTQIPSRGLFLAKIVKFLQGRKIFPLHEHRRSRR